MMSVAGAVLTAEIPEASVVRRSNSHGLLSGLRRTAVAFRDLVEAWPDEVYEAPVVEGRLLGRPVTFLVDPERIQLLLTDHAPRLARDAAMVRSLAPLLGTGLLLADGEAWRTQRRTAVPAFRPERVQSCLPAMAAAAAATRRRWLEGGARHVDLQAEMMRTALDVITATVVSGEEGFDPTALSPPHWTPTSARRTGRWPTGSWARPPGCRIPGRGRGQAGGADAARDDGGRDRAPAPAQGGRRGPARRHAGGHRPGHRRRLRRRAADRQPPDLRGGRARDHGAGDGLGAAPARRSPRGRAARAGRGRGPARPARRPGRAGRPRLHPAGGAGGDAAVPAGGPAGAARHRGAEPGRRARARRPLDPRPGLRPAPPPAAVGRSRTASIPTASPRRSRRPAPLRLPAVRRRAARVRRHGAGARRVPGGAGDAAAGGAVAPARARAAAHAPAGDAQAGGGAAGAVEPAWSA